MAFVSFQVLVEGMEVLKQRMSASTRPAEHAVAVQAAKDTEPYVPMRTGSLSARTQVEGNRVVYPGPYARYLYMGKVMVDSRTGKGPMKIVDGNGNEFIRFRKGARLVPTARDLDISTAVHPKAQAKWLEASKTQNLERWKRAAKEAVRREL